MKSPVMLSLNRNSMCPMLSPRRQRRRSLCCWFPVNTLGYAIGTRQTYLTDPTPKRPFWYLEFDELRFGRNASVRGRAFDACSSATQQVLGFSRLWLSLDSFAREMKSGLICTEDDKKFEYRIC